MTPIPLVPGLTPLAALEAVYRTAAPVAVDRGARAAVDAAVAVVERAAAGEAAVYGVNTGFGKLASLRIPPADTAQLQKNLVRSHASGVGPPLSAPVVRLVIALKILSLGRGASGVRWAVVELLEGLINHGITPVIPAQGSVGASGDLAPLAHLSLVLIGEGEAMVAGRIVSAAEALASAGLASVTLGAKEGLGLINGTQVSTALAFAGVFDGWRLALTSLLSAALTTDAAMGSTAPLRPELHALRGHRGQIDAAAAMERLLTGSQIRESHREGDERVQDPYCIRCQPQVAGAAMDLLRTQAALLETEANAVTDNPLVIGDDIVSGGNFHAEPVAFAADIIALAVAEIGSIAQRRVALIVDPTLSYGLPPFLTPKPGLNSGFMIAEVTAAALMSENKQRAAPASIDSTPTSASQEDHVSMACHAARRLGDMNTNLARILAIELLAAAQGVRFRAPLRTSPALAGVLAALEALSPPLEEDRSLAPDIERVAVAVEAGTLLDVLPAGTLPALA